MTRVADDLLPAFDALNPTEKQTVAVEILRRSAGAAELPEDALTEAAENVFLGYEDEHA